jgi:predicted nucleic acid-binding protein
MISRYNGVLFDAGMFIGALLRDDLRYAEARPLVEAARRGDLAACTTTSTLSEVYAALTWIKAQPPILQSKLREPCVHWSSHPRQLKY